MTEPLILAVDLGTSSMKVALITVNGKVLAGKPSRSACCSHRMAARSSRQMNGGQRFCQQRDGCSSGSRMRVRG